MLVLALAQYDKLCQRTSFSMLSGTVDIGSIWRVLGKEKAQALPIFHTFTRADNVGKLSRIGKTKWLQQYIKVGIESPTALMKLSVEVDLAQEVKEELAKFVCSMYSFALC